jgi:MFS family permease
MENNTDTLDGVDGEARVALEAVRRGQAAAADRLTTPWWYHPALGALVALLVLACGSGRYWLQAVAMIFFAIGTSALVAAYRSSTGMWISGHRAGRASRWAYAMGGLVAVCLIFSFLTAQAGGARWFTWLLALVAFVATIVLGRRFDAELRAQLRRGE